MRLDVPTLTAVIFLNALAMAVALTAVSDFKSRPGTRFWVWGAWAQALGWGVLIAGYRSGTFWLLSMAAVCFSASFSFAHRSVLSFLGREGRQPWLWVAPLCVAMLHPAAQFFESPHLRIGVVALASLLQSVALVLSLLRAPAGSADGWKWFLVVMMSASAGFALLKLCALAVSSDPTLASGEGINVLGLLIASVTLNLNSLALLLAQRTHALADFLSAAATRYGFDAGQLNALGYSNGANIAASLLLLRPETLAGAVLLRPMVVLEPRLVPNLQGKRIAILSGRYDPIVPADHPERLAAMFRQAGAEVDLHWFEAGHQLTGADFRLAGQFLHDTPARR